MHMRKRTALLVAAMGVLLVGGAGGADAADKPARQALPGDGGSQKNRCDTSSVIGGINLVTSSDASTETNCVNYAESGVSEQSNRCRTHSVIGPVTVNLSGEKVTHRTNCVNISKSGAVSKQSNDCKTTSVIGPISIGPGEVTQETNCTNLAGVDPANGKAKQKAGAAAGTQGG